ncbi:peptidoglycan D,D-transpeptidase FtsI family protein [Paenibacillus sp. CN-4]|uniref:peptidoglycan D,D-transpeptidase FtsI family protein n=1 Tax=Paenibacillus nanchangensis TaxID=3348343 RepID=UPI00397BA6CE
MKLFSRLNPAGEREESGKTRLNSRINAFFFGAFLIFCLILLRLTFVQIVQGQDLSEAEAKRDTRDVPLPAIRGSIKAAGGENLAYSVPVQSLYFTLSGDYTKTGPDGTPTPEALAKADELAKSLAADFARYGSSGESQPSKENILDALDLGSAKAWGYMSRRIKSGLGKAEVAYFMEQRERYPGLEVVEESERLYSKDTVAVQTVGYTKQFKYSDSIPKYQDILQKMNKQADPGLNYRSDEYVGYDGLELLFQEELRGRNGYKTVSINPQNLVEGVESVTPPVKGYDVWTTINKHIQLKTEQAIMDRLDWLHSHPVEGKLHKDALTGYAVAMEVDTGHVVAMASMPDYDANVWRNLTTEAWDQIMSRYQNGAVTPNASGKSGHGFESAVFLGSTIKPLTVLVGLKEGFITTSTQYVDTGRTAFGKKGHEQEVSNASGHVYGKMDPALAIELSSNVFMIDKVALPLYRKYQDRSLEIWDRYMKDFGLGVAPGSGLPGEYKGLLNYKNPEAAGSTQAAMVYASFGQQAKYTPLTLAQYASTLANEGKRIKPQLVSRITDEQGRTVRTFGREVLSEASFDPTHWREIRSGMNSDVKEAFAGFPYDFARKTGTSEQEYWSKGRRQVFDNGVFIAYAPRENPKLAVAVVIPEGGFGSKSAAPVARAIFDAYDWEYGLDGVPKKNARPAAES